MNNSAQSQALQYFDSFFRSAPAQVNVEAIRQEWLALKFPYAAHSRQLPVPVWARRGFSDDGPQAWKTLPQTINAIESDRPFCIYIHIPFCASRCSFCDCYSFQLRQHQERHIARYVDILCQEIRLWSQMDALRCRPVSTIHFGGGTPTFLGSEHLARLVDCMNRNFRIEPQTEWALETTSSNFSRQMQAELESLGFRRLHIGVQSLQDNVRQILNRHEPATRVLEAIAHAAKSGWVVTVDLICGLPDQSLPGLLDDVHTLVNAGVDGFSLYELQLSPRNRKFAQKYGLSQRNHLTNYFLFQAAARAIESQNYEKTLFNHFAGKNDTNLYFTFPERGEDCLALGTVGDGVFGDYHYRHPEYAAYCRGVLPTFPGLEGGLRRNKIENHLFPLEVAIMSGRIGTQLMEDILGTERANSLIQCWRESSLVEDVCQPEQEHVASSSWSPGYLRLTSNGSWLTGNMMMQLCAGTPFECVETSDPQPPDRTFRGPQHCPPSN